MKLPVEILLRSGEGQYVEYKSCFDRRKNNPLEARPRVLKSVAKDIAICLAEMANADGGTLLLGVENDGSVTGCPYTQEQMEDLRTMITDSWKRPVPYQYESIVHHQRGIAVFEVDPQADVFTLTDGRTPYRNNDQTVWLAADDVQALRRGKGSTLVERTITSFTTADIDKSLLQRFREKVDAPSSLTDEQLLMEYDLAVRNGTGIRLTLAACLLFGTQPMTRFHERCGINFRRFDGIAHSQELEIMRGWMKRLNRRSPC